MIDYREDNGTVTFSVRVTARASRTEIAGEIDGSLKVRLAAPPVDGAANEELVRLLADEFCVRRSDVEILAGHTTRTKRVRITECEPERFVQLLKQE